MKDSGIEWIGNVPRDWEIVRIKEKYSFNTGFTPDTQQSNYYNDENGYEWATIADIVEGKVNTPTKSLVSRSFIEQYHKKMVKPNSLLYSFKLSVGQTAITDRPMYTNEALASFEQTSENNIDFLKYSSMLIEYNANTNIYGAKILNQQLIKNAYVTFPNLQEQCRIADFLDEKCDEIDSLTKDIQEQIATLEEYKKSVITEIVTKGLDSNVEMKDSGIEWIGTIPKYWAVEKIKYHLQRKEPRNPGNVQVLSVYREYGVIPKDSRDDNHNVTSEDTSKYKYVKPGNLVINKMKAWQGSLAISEYEGIVSPAYFIYHFIDDVFNKKYFHYLIRSCYKDEFRRISTGIREGQWDLPSRDFENELVLIPPKNEQNDIVNYLDSKCSEIDAIIQTKKEQLDVLAEYKKSLIYEYVTGKKEVPVNE